MARGPAPTPTKLLKVRGSWRAKTRENEPELPVKAPPAPAFLNAEAEREWARQVKHLQTMGVIAEADRALLAFYCQAWAEFLEVNADLKKEGLTFSTETGYILPHPLVAIRNGAFERRKNRRAVWFLAGGPGATEGRHRERGQARWQSAFLRSRLSSQKNGVISSCSSPASIRSPRPAIRGSTSRPRKRFSTFFPSA